MFCNECGTELANDVVYCTNCGNNLKKSTKTENKIEDNQIIFRVKPTFKFGYQVAPSLITFSIIILIFVAIVCMASIEAGLILGLICFIIFGLVLTISTAIKKKQFNSFVYDFYKTKVIFKDSFLNIAEKEVKYKYIREVTMRQTFMQRFFNIGTIILFTNAETGFGNGILLGSIEDVQKVYRQIKSIIDV